MKDSRVTILAWVVMLVAISAAFCTWTLSDRVSQLNERLERLEKGADRTK